MSLAFKNLEAVERDLKAREDAFKIAEDELHSARKIADTARKEYQETEEDLKLAKKHVEAANKKWKVIDLAEDDDDDLSGTSDRGHGLNASLLLSSQAQDIITAEGCCITEIKAWMEKQARVARDL